MALRYCRRMTVDTHAPAAECFDQRLVTAALEAAFSLPRPVPVFAIGGLQGTGKSTLGGADGRLAQIAWSSGRGLSIDDSI